MYKLVTGIIIYCLVLSSILQAKIIETSCFADILTEVDSNTVVFIDIDDTMINTTSMLGNTLWWNYFVSHVTKANLPLDKARPKINLVIQKILEKVPMYLIEPRTSEIIKKFQSQGILTFALTARCINADYMQAADLGTYKHLKSVGIDFTLTPLPKQVDADTARFFSYGIIFTDHREKGPFLKTFLNNMDLHPTKIVFIDDNMKQIESVESVVESMNIPYTGFRYANLDNFHKQFNPLIGNIQLEALLKNDQVLSDDEAFEIAQKNKDLNPDYFLNELIEVWRSY